MGRLYSQAVGINCQDADSSLVKEHVQSIIGTTGVARVEILDRPGGFVVLIGECSRKIARKIVQEIRLKALWNIVMYK